ncbi:LPS-assembly protein LptD [Xylella fastidiosa]|uniref:LPS-assembly protein LptD n=1 Tax=Xylella fastidiosa TaxID=2371 RepID=UPI0009002AD6|nr:LPS-assembly protein LptD [Xylella fastidiosa]MDD0929940.1 LPS-assembly protein LptD [Xylella fastidiosa subsp. multiplex]MDD0943206.1 LPS-assembly protein LptD [Xylella fastidiosa subsp. multiplex]QTX27733.1 LPS-assembly protein LptD [Xylella fastidiosa subsp. multiplex]QTX29735.1 LPS-assembly protein LptD [Xylella fastidiosa subsp. multiplex]TNV91058.1 LPS-assembly protein LptD [Xylella fastidiosa]
MYRVLRLLPLPLSVAISLSALADEKPPNWGLCPATLPLQGFEQASGMDKHVVQSRPQLPTNIEGDTLTGTARTPLYQGNVLMARGDQFLGADSVRMDTETDSYVAEGHVRYQDSSILVVADRAEGNQDTDVHKIINIQYQLIGRRGNGVAKSVDIHGQVGQTHEATYTTCDPSQAIWRLRAPEIDVDNVEGFGVARHAVFEVGQWPVLYLPWFKFPIDSRRQTGLLYPQLGYSGRNGFDYAQPIYLNLAPNYDATLYPRYMQKRGFMIDTEFRYLYDDGKWQTRAAFIPNDQLRDKDRGRFSFNGYHNIDNHWQARASLAWVSDNRYMEDFSSRLVGMSSLSSLQSTVGVYGTGETWTAGLMADRWQLTDYSLDESALAYNRQPRLFFNWDKPVLDFLEFGLYSEVVRFKHDDAYLVALQNDGNYLRTGEVTRYYGGTRLDVKPYVSLPFTGASWYVTPTFGWRYSSYYLDSGIAEQLNGSRTPVRSLPIVSLDSGVYLDRDTTVFGGNYLNTLEPRFYYLYVPYRNQSDLPLFDTRAFTFSWGQLFRDSRYTGPDRQNDANQLTLAVTSRWLDQNTGKEDLALSVGQILYFKDSLVTLNDSEERIQQGKSVWVSDLAYNVNDRWTLNATYQWNPNFRRDDLASIRARYLIGSDGIINLAYRYRRNTLDGTAQLKQTDFSFLYPINPRWSAIGRYYYSLLDKKPLEIIGGLQWDSCCLAVRTVLRRHMRDRTGNMDNSIQLEFVFKGLSSVGQDTDRVLRRAILGYYRDDLYLVPPSNTTTDPDAYDPNKIP